MSIEGFENYFRRFNATRTLEDGTEEVIRLTAEDVIEAEEIALEKTDFVSEKLFTISEQHS